MPLTKITAAQNEVAHSHHRLRGIYSLAVIFAATINVAGTKHAHSDRLCAKVANIKP